MMQVIFSFFRNWANRINRLILHLVYPFYQLKKNPIPSKGIVEWSTDIFYYLMDCAAIPEFYYFFFRIVKWKIRRLTPAEIELGQAVFGNSIRYDSVRIDDDAKLGTQKIAVAYVSFNMINFRKNIKKEIFIHELVHIWQFQQFGSIYLARAIKAQRSKEGYDYGGVANLYQEMLKGGRLLDFNFEQQADIIEDYYNTCVKNKYTPGAMQTQIYKYFVDQLKI